LYIAIALIVALTTTYSCQAKPIDSATEYYYYTYGTGDTEGGDYEYTTGDQDYSVGEEAEDDQEGEASADGTEYYYYTADDVTDDAAGTYYYYDYTYQ